MARLTLPAPKIDLYIDGFDEHDQLGRKSFGASLSDLIERIEEPMVIALDGGWGTGKSHFLQCWAGEHLKQDGAVAQTVYFDAFAVDFMDEPLVSLLACMSNRFEDALGDDADGKLDKLRKVAWKLGPAALRIAASIGTFGATNHLDDAGDAIAGAIGAEVSNSAESFWKAAQERPTLMAEFHAALEALTTTKDDGARKLVIIVDELDRCRPDYALALLEIIKHFFAVDNVHFVLGVNLRELENSVLARYGTRVSAELYLQKFITLTMALPNQTDAHFPDDVSVIFLKRVASELGIENDTLLYVEKAVQAVSDRKTASLRGIQRLLTIVQTTPAMNSSHFRNDHHRDVIASLLILKAWHRDLYEKALHGTISIKDLETVFHPPLRKNEFSPGVFESWDYYLDPEAFDALFGPSPALPSIEERRRDLIQLIKNTVEVFQIND